MHMHRSLPHRQLRNVIINPVVQQSGSLPHRQLRNYLALTVFLVYMITAA